MAITQVSNTPWVQQPLLISMPFVMHQPLTSSCPPFIPSPDPNPANRLRKLPVQVLHCPLVSIRRIPALIFEPPTQSPIDECAFIKRAIICLCIPLDTPVYLHNTSALQSSNLIPLPPEVSIKPPRYEPFFFLFFSFVKPLPLVTIKSACARSA